MLADRPGPASHAGPGARRPGRPPARPAGRQCKVFLYRSFNQILHIR